MLSQISHFVVLSSEYQVTMNPNTGKKERIFVDLATLYPTPNEAGTELSFEEIWAMNRGWLDRSWEEESVMDENVLFDDENSPHVFGGHASRVETMSRGVEKLVIHRDVGVYDENGAVMEKPRASKSKKIKVMEVNETQISK